MTFSAAGRCPRCRGRLVEQQDQYGRYRSCLTCGFIQEWQRGPDLRASASPTGHPVYRQPVHDQQQL